MAYFDSNTIDFLWQLRVNNNKPWFTENKPRFETYVNKPMKQLAQDVFSKLDEDNKDKNLTYKVARIYKDARRVKGGDPYRDNLWFFIEKTGEDFTTTPGFWFEIGCEGWSYGLGYYQAKALTMAKFRARLDNKPEDFKKLLKSTNIAKSNFTLGGEEYKRKKDSPLKLEEWYNRKNFSLSYESSSHSEIYAQDLAEVLVQGFSLLMPIYSYFATLDNDPDPRY